MTELLYARHLGTTSSQSVFGLRWEICEHAVRKKEKKMFGQESVQLGSEQPELCSTDRTYRIRKTK